MGRRPQERRADRRRELLRLGLGLGLRLGPALSRIGYARNEYEDGEKDEGGNRLPLLAYVIQTEAERRRREAGVKQSMEIRVRSCT